MRKTNYLDRIPLSLTQSFKEEVANAVTHGLGFLGSIAALTILLVMAVKYGDTNRVVAFAVYGSSMVLLYTFSTLYHAFKNIKAKKVLRICDHVSIYLLIAGSYTPITMLVMDAGGTVLLSVAWAFAALGIMYEIFFLGRSKTVCVSLYLTMGWIAVFAIKPIMVNMEASAIVWLLVGGLSYSLGVIFYVVRRIPFNHAIWHCFVLFGSISHFICVYKVGFSSY
ncbi:MAG: hemolysin III family protein [Deltaproteobacteria bacterium]